MSHWNYQRFGEILLQKALNTCSQSYSRAFKRFACLLWRAGCRQLQLLSASAKHRSRRIFCSAWFWAMLLFVWIAECMKSTLFFFFSREAYYRGLYFSDMLGPPSRKYSLEGFTWWWIILKISWSKGCVYWNWSSCASQWVPTMSTHCSI